MIIWQDFSHYNLGNWGKTLINTDNLGLKSWNQENYLNFNSTLYIMYIFNSFKTAGNPHVPSFVILTAATASDWKLSWEWRGALHSWYFEGNDK